MERKITDMIKPIIVAESEHLRFKLIWNWKVEFKLRRLKISRSSIIKLTMFACSIIRIILRTHKMSLLKMDSKWSRKKSNNRIRKLRFRINLKWARSSFMIKVANRAFNKLNKEGSKVYRPALTECICPLSKTSPKPISFKV